MQKLRTALRFLESLIRQFKIEIVIAAGLFVFMLVGATVYTKLATSNVRYDLGGQVPHKKVAIVFGAGVNRDDGTPTPYLKWRIETAVSLYKNGTVERLLVSGDNSTKHYNEPEVMKRYAESLGVPARDVVADFAGLNSYDTCYRAKHIFGVNDAVVVTQGYHLPRAIVTCRGLGIETVGVATAHTGRDFTLSYVAREYISTVKALIQLQFKPLPTVLGGPETSLQ
jgi:vancomycin permeability regulator SanA